MSNDRFGFLERLKRYPSSSYGPYDMEEYGLWIVYGEDPNPDLGGNHQEPMLGTFEGKYTDIIDYAVNMDGFWQWGWGGSIKKLRVIKIPVEEK